MKQEKAAAMLEKHRTTVAAMPASRFGGWTPKLDPRVQFSLCRVGGKLYFLNQTAQVLDKVTNTSVGIVRTDDEGGGAPTSEFKVSYDMVQPGEAVLMDEFDDCFDGDCVVYAVIDVQADGNTESFSVSAKGGLGTKVLKKSS